MHFLNDFLFLRNTPAQKNRIFDLLLAETAPTNHKMQPEPQTRGASASAASGRSCPKMVGLFSRFAILMLNA